MDVTEMDQKPTSSGVRNKQKRNKALVFRWKAVFWAADHEPRAAARWAFLGDTAFGEVWRGRGVRAVLAPLLPWPFWGS